MQHNDKVLTVTLRKVLPESFQSVTIATDIATELDGDRTFVLPVVLPK